MIFDPKKIAEALDKKDEYQTSIHYQKSTEMGHTERMNELSNYCQNMVKIENYEPKAFINYQTL